MNITSLRSVHDLRACHAWADITSGTHLLALGTAKPGHTNQSRRKVRDRSEQRTKHKNCIRSLIISLKLLHSSKESMGPSRIAVAPRYADPERLKMEGKQTQQDDHDESLAALLAKGATHVAKAFGSGRKPNADNSVSESLRSVQPSLRAQACPRMPSFRNLRGLPNSKKETYIGYPNDGQASPGVLLSRDQIPEHVRILLSPNWEDSFPLDSSTIANGAVDSADLTTGSKRRCSSPRRVVPSQSYFADAPEQLLLRYSREPEILTTKRQHQTQTKSFNPPMHHQDIQTSPYPTKRMDSYTMQPPMNHQDIQTSPYATKRMGSYTMHPQAPMLDSYSRPRSRAIAIKRGDRCAEDLAASQTEESNERMYDWATWRMYNRIVDHRRNQNFGVPGPLPVSIPRSKPQPVAGLPQHVSDRTYDGEVFELEI
jgi:hypothetical protein